MIEAKKPRVLIVDDDENVLTGFKRNLRARFHIETGLGPLAGVEKISAGEPFSVIVSDYQMPVMNGIEFLGKARELAPDSVRVMLTGNANLDMAIESVNTGAIFRFMTKPCRLEQMHQTLDAGVAQYNLVRAERELLEKTLTGCVRILTEMLALTNPTAFGRGARVQRMVGPIARELGIEEVWKIEIAAMLSQAGCVTIPNDVLAKIMKGHILSKAEEEMHARHPGIGAALIEKIPRLEDMAEIVRHQLRRFDGGYDSEPGSPRPEPGAPRGHAIPLGARILRAALDFDALTNAGKTQHEAADELERRQGKYDPAVVAALRKWIMDARDEAASWVKIEDMVPGMVLAEDVRTTSEVILIARGTEVTSSMKLRLLNFSDAQEIVQPIKVYWGKQ